MLLTVMNVVWAAVVTHHYRLQSPLKVMETKLKFLWVLLNLSFLPALLITSVYWLAIYDPGNSYNNINNNFTNTKLYITIGKIKFKQMVSHEVG